MPKKGSTIDLDPEVVTKALRRTVDYRIHSITGAVHFALRLIAESAERADGSLVWRADQVQEAAKATLKRKAKVAGRPPGEEMGAPTLERSQERRKA